MNGLMSKLYYIQEECGGGEQSAQDMQQDAQLDDFTRMKKKISRQVKQIRGSLQEREELLSNTSNTMHTVQMSANIRSQLKAVKEDAERLRDMQKKEEEKIRKKLAKKGGDEKEESLLSNRAEVVDLCFKHIEECEILEKGRYSTHYARSALTSNNNAPTVTQLPDIDDADFQVLKQNDKRIDIELDEISSGVNTLKELAIGMNKEIKKQTMMIDELDTKADKHTAKLQNLNKRLKDTLEKVRSGKNFIIDFILLCVLLAIGAYIYNMVK